MISVVYYGRNDSHGYNLHKRVALGINCVAAALDAEGDEILFVDYNSADGLPTLPEALADTLTEAARRLLRIIRVRPHFHGRYRGRTHLPVLEPVARNIAIRRSNPANHWILSSNPDMILAPKDGRSLSAIAAGLDDALWHVPRFELPEAVWETFDRRDPAAAVAAARRCGAAAHLEEVVRCEVALFDAVGDFQLAPRADLFRIGGFHEALLQGWHLDSNLAKRFALLHGAVRDLSGEVAGYHCDHTRLATATHRPDHLHNSWFTAFDGVTQPDLPEQAESWGSPATAFEEVRLADPPAQRHVAAIITAVGPPAPAPYETVRTPASYGDVATDPRHVLPYLADAFAAAPRGWSVAWSGADAGLLGRFARFWAAAGFRGQVLVVAAGLSVVPPEAAGAATVQPAESAFAACDAFIFDFPAASAAPPESGGASAVDAAFLAAVEHERARVAAGEPPRLFVCTNALHNHYEQMVRSHVDLVPTPFSTRTRHGFVRARPLRAPDWVPRLEIGAAGRRSNGAICTLRGQGGTVAFGPHEWLPPGRYRARIRVVRGPLVSPLKLIAWMWNLGQIAHLAVAAGGKTLVKSALYSLVPREQEIALDFEIAGGSGPNGGANDVELWIWTHAIHDFEIRSAVVESLAPAGADPAG